MRSRVVLILVFCGLLTEVGLAQGQQPPPPTETGRFGNPTGTARTYQTYLYGVIKSVDEHAMVLAKTKFGVDQTFKLEAKTKYVHNKKRSSQSDLKVGDQVFVDFRKDKKTGELIAKKVVTGAEVVPVQ